MCTLTWRFDEAGYALFFNRDERVGRAEAAAPRVLRVGELAALAPIDGEAGGTWLGVNERGVTLAVLNGYEHERLVDGREPKAPGKRSRGLLVLDLLAAPELAHIDEVLEREALDRYRPFHLFGLERGRRGPRAWSWTGEALEAREVQASERPIVSSAIHLEEVRESRRRLFAKLGNPEDLGALEAYHRGHRPERGALSVCMHREDAATRSFSRVVVGEESALFEHVDGPPCSGAQSERYALGLLSATAR